MPYEITHDSYNKCLFAPKLSRIYGDELLTETTLSDPLSPSAWTSRLRKQQQYPDAWNVCLFEAMQVDSLAVNQQSIEVLKSSQLEEKNPSTQGDLLLDVIERQLLDLICRLFKSLPISYRERIVIRLLTLISLAKEEDPLCTGLSIGSVRNFYSFLQLNPNLKYPAITRTPDSNIYSTWRGSNNRVFSVHFLPSAGDARFVVLEPNKKYPERQVQIYGTATVDVISEKIVQSGLMSWMTE